MNTTRRPSGVKLASRTNATERFEVGTDCNIFQLPVLISVYSSNAMPPPPVEIGIRRGVVALGVPGTDAAGSVIVWFVELTNDIGVIAPHALDAMLRSDIARKLIGSDVVARRKIVLRSGR